MPPRLTATYALKGVWFAVIACLMLLSIGFGAVQTVRLEGLKIWPFTIEGARPKAERLAADLKSIRAAQDEAEETQRLANEQAERRYQKLAKEIDDEAEKDLADGRDAAERFIAAGGVQHKAADCPSGRADRTARSDRARNPEGTRAPAVMDATVAVYPDDIRICTENSVKAQAAHDFALAIEASSKGD